MNEAQRLARLVLAVCAVWAAVFAAVPPDTLTVLAVGQTVLGVAGAIICVVVAVHPTGRGVQVALAGAAVYAAWNAVRAVVTPTVDGRIVVRGVASHALIATFCLAAASMHGTMVRLERLAEAVDDDR